MHHIDEPMTSDPKALVQRLWAFCDILRDDGLSYGDYLEQLTYLLFLKIRSRESGLTKPWLYRRSAS